MEMQSYQVARTFFYIVSLLSGAIVFGGVIFTLVAMDAVAQTSRNFGGSSMAGLAGLLPGVVMIIFGLFGLAWAQIGRAGVDTAELTQQGLKVAREQLEVSRQMLTQGAALEKGYAALEAAKADLRRGSEPAAAATQSQTTEAKPVPQTDPAIMEPPPKIIDYRGTQIRHHQRGYYVGSLFFADLQRAERHIDQTMDGADLSDDLSAATEEAISDIDLTDTSTAPDASAATRT